MTGVSWGMAYSTVDLFLFIIYGYSTGHRVGLILQLCSESLWCSLYKSSDPASPLFDNNSSQEKVTKVKSLT